jgi:hypothetical protein
MNLVLEHFIRSTKGAVTKEFDRKDIPLAFRGILKKKYIEECFDINRTFYYIDTGYFGNYPSPGNPLGFKKWHRIIKNNLQTSFLSFSYPRDRLDTLESSDSRLIWKGWKKTGRNILLVVPSEKPCKYYEIDKSQWLTDVCNEIKKHTDKNIIIREKTSRSERVRKNTIYDAFDEDIFAVVTYNSIAAVESIAYGIPAFVLAPSAAGIVSSSDLSKIETPHYPDEHLIEHWKRTLSYNQFTDNEIITGKAWSIINDH